MRKNSFFILIFLLLQTKLYSQNSSEYHKEEFNVINEVFVELVGEHNYYQDGFIPLMPDQDLIRFAKHPDKYKDELEYGNKQFYPFQYSKKLIATKGEKRALKNFRDEFYKFSDSIESQIDDRRLVVYVDDTLTSINASRRQEFIKNVQQDSILLNIYSNKTIDYREFDFSKINRKGRFEISNEKYPDREKRNKTKNIKEIGLIKFSRIIFNADYSKGYFFFYYHENGLNAGESILRIEKEDGNWVIKDGILLWVA